MTDRVFVDTNILVYGFDRSEMEKQLKAIEILNRLFASRLGVISTRVLAEFFTTVTNQRRSASPLTADEAYGRVLEYIISWEVIEVTTAIVLEAARGVRDHQFSFWDAQIWATAKLNQVSTVYSEDFSVGAIVEGVQFVNPLA